MAQQDPAAPSASESLSYSSGEKLGEERRPVVLHILPEDGPGGAELAARSAAVANETVHLLFLKGQAHPALGPHERIHFAGAKGAMSFRAVRRAVDLCKRLNPDVVVFSLWRSWLAMLVLSMLCRNPPRVLFLHNDRSMHWVDATATLIMEFLSVFILADSWSALSRLWTKGAGTNARVVTFLMHKPRLRRRSLEGSIHALRFIYWGRFSDQKDIPRSLSLFSKVKSAVPEATFELIGPDSGALDQVRRSIVELQISGAVSLRGLVEFSEIAEKAAGAHFFVQLSRCEGMAMSVAEAMQLGLVPIVTPVGEIAQYCRDGENAIVVRDDGEAVKRILEVVDDPEWYAQMSKMAQETFAGAPTYSEDFMLAAGEIVNSRNLAGQGAVRKSSDAPIG